MEKSEFLEKKKYEILRIINDDFMDYLNTGLKTDVNKGENRNFLMIRKNKKSNNNDSYLMIKKSGDTINGK